MRGARRRGFCQWTVTATEQEPVVDAADLIPAYQLFVHLLGEGGPVARVEGAAPVTAEWVREHLGEKCRFRIMPVLDPLDQIPVDAWEIPTRHRQVVHLLTPADTFPFASSTTREMQIDHTRPTFTAGRLVSRGWATTGR